MTPEVKCVALTFDIYSSTVDLVRREESAIMNNNSCARSRAGRVTLRSART